MNVPVLGQFSDGQGIFYADDVIAYVTVTIRCTWISIDYHLSRWEQAFSNGGAN